MFRLALGLLAGALAAQAVRADTVVYTTASGVGRVDAYCTDGAGGITARPVHSIGLARGSDSFPRRILFSRTNLVLYVAEKDRVEAFKIGDGGSLSSFGQTEPIVGMTPQDIALSLDERTLYVPQRSKGRIVGFTLLPDGSLPSQFTSCVKSADNTGWQNLAISEQYLYVGIGNGNDRIEIFPLRPDGRLAVDATVTAGEANCPLPPTAQSNGAPVCPNPGDPTASTTTTSVAGEPDPNCPISRRTRVSAPGPMILSGDFLYIEKRLSNRIIGFRLTNGLFNPPLANKKHQQKVNTHTAFVVTYQDLIPMVDPTTGLATMLFGSSFFSGRVDTIVLKPTGQLPKHKKVSTAKYVRATPVGLAVDPDKFTLYVAGGSNDRVQAFRLRKSGGRAGLPKLKSFSSSDDMGGTFPNELAIAVLPGSCP